ncbi:hypothetical protein BDV12DRAFT_200845 [Aspergillus spectabilis]
MGLFRPKFTPLPSNIDLTDKTAVITGATAGLSLETARQLLHLNISIIILATRNISKGQSCIRDLYNDPIIQSRKLRAEIQVLELDMDRHDSIQSFAKALRETVPAVDIFILDAGVNFSPFKRSLTDHEHSMQVNYLSSVLLLAELLPYFESSAEKTGSTVRITWLGSRTYYVTNTLEKTVLTKSEQGLLEYMNSEKDFKSLTRYADNKLLYAMFVYALAPRLDIKKITINMVCPGVVKTDLGYDSPWYIRGLVGALRTIRARPVEIGGLLVVNAAVVAGDESHGQILVDKEIVQPIDYLQSSQGQRLQEKLWIDTVEEMAKHMVLPSAFTE